MRHCLCWLRSCRHPHDNQPVKESVKEPVKEQVKEPVKETVKETAVLLAEASALLAVEVGHLPLTIFFVFEHL